MSNKISAKLSSKAIKRDQSRFALLAETFQAMGDPTRVKLLWLLSKKQESSVGQLVTELKISQPGVSHHLRLLRAMRLVKTRREGRMVFYSLDDDHIGTLLHEGLEHVEDLLV